MNTLKVTGVKVNSTARDWQLFSGEDGIDECAVKLNKTFEDSVSAGMDREGVEDEVNKVMFENSHLGAEDSEPDWHLQKLLNSVFNRE